MTQKSKLTAASLALALAVMIAFYPGLAGEFVSWDDPVYVTANVHVKDSSWDTVTWAFTSFDAANWHPLTWLSLALDHHLYGLEPFGYHLTSLLIHTANAVLVFLVIFHLTGAFWQSLGVAILFGLHPLRVESVSWVAERKDVLSAFFWLLTMAAYVRYVRLKSLNNYLLVVLAFTMGLLSKPVIVTLPAALLLLDYWPLRRLSWRTVLEKLPLAALSTACMALVFAAQQSGGAVQIDPIPLLDRVANSLAAYVQYLALTFWPQALSPWYAHPALEGPALSHWQVLGAATLLAGITAVVLFRGRLKPYLPVGWFWFLGTLVPMIGLVQVGRQGMADRYTYIPHIGLFLLLVWGISGLPVWKSHRARVVGAVVTVGLALVLASLTWRQTAVWSNNLALWSYTAERSPNAFIAHQALGLELQRLRRYDEALISLQRASTIRPEIASVHFNVATLLDRNGQLGAALARYREAAALKPDSASYHNRLGVTLLRLGRPREAREPIERAIALKPGYAEAHYNLGHAWLAQSMFEEAAKEFQTALRAKPTFTAARQELEKTLRMLEK